MKSLIRFKSLELQGWLFYIKRATVIQATAGVYGAGLLGNSPASFIVMAWQF
jgi:hypothetical protein